MTPPTSTTPTADRAAAGGEGRTAFLTRIASMSSKQRLDAARSGSFDRSQRALWALAYPEEVPLVNGEVEWIALGLADLD